METDSAIKSPKRIQHELIQLLDTHPRDHDLLKNSPSQAKRLIFGIFLIELIFHSWVEPSFQEKDNLPTKDALLGPFPIALVHFLPPRKGQPLYKGQSAKVSFTWRSQTAYILQLLPTYRVTLVFLDLLQWLLIA